MLLTCSSLLLSVPFSPYVTSATNSLTLVTRFCRRLSVVPFFLALVSFHHSTFPLDQSRIESFAIDSFEASYPCSLSRRNEST